MDYWFKSTIINSKSVFWTIAFIIIIPLIINECYKANCFYITKWEAADVLSYYGSFIGAIGTVLGVYLSIKHTQYKLESDTRNRVMPFLVLHGMKLNRVIDKKKYVPFLVRRLSNGCDSNDTEEDGINYSEDQIKECYFVITNNLIKHVAEFTEAQKNAIRSNKLYYGVLVGDNKKVAYFPKVVENVGVGAAINCRINLYVKKENKNIYSTPISIPPYKDFKFGLYFEFDKEKYNKNYIMELYYEDILGNEYFQEISFEVIFNPDENNEKGEPIICKVNEAISCKHKLIKEKQND